MQVFLNKTFVEVEPGTTLQELVDRYRPNDIYLIVAVNYEVIQHLRWSQTELFEGDSIVFLDPPKKQ